MQRHVCPGGAVAVIALHTLLTFCIILQVEATLEEDSSWRKLKRTRIVIDACCEQLQFVIELR